MAIEGPLKELGIHDVFQLLDLNRKTGVLRVTSDLRHNQGVVWFQGGSVVYAEIRSNPHPLGDLLVRSGKVAEADFKRARSMQESGDKRQIGEILVSIGAISEQELERQVRFQVEEVIFEMMSWREGYFSFVEEPVDENLGDGKTRIRIEALLMEGARRIDEWSRMERKIPHVGVIPALEAAEGGNGGGLDLLPTEWEVLAMVDGERDIRGIAAALARSEFDVAKTIFGMESAGIVTVLSRPSGGVGVVEDSEGLEELLASAEAAVAKPDLEGARATVERALVRHPHDARLYVLMGRINLAANRESEAEESLRRALRLDSLLAPAHRLLGDALARQGRLNEATAWWGRWLRLNEEAGAAAAPSGPIEAAIRAARTLEGFLRT